MGVIVEGPGLVLCHPDPAAAVVGVALLLPFTILGRWFGFVPPPAALLLTLAGLLLCYLVLAEIVKRAFYHALAGGS